MANPIAVKGIRKIIDKLGDEVLEAAKKAKNLNVEGTTFEASGSMTLNGKYGIDNKGNLGFVGNAIVKANATGELPVEIGEGEAQTDLSTGSEWNSMGDGTMEASFEVRVTIGKPLAAVDLG